MGMDTALRPEELSKPCTAAPWTRQGLCPPDGLLTGEQGAAGAGGLSQRARQTEACTSRG